VSERTGIGLVDVAVLDALATLGARPDRGFMRCSRVLAFLKERIGLAPEHGYSALLDLALPWKIAVPLVSGQGNVGAAPGDQPDGPDETQCRLSRVGLVAVDAEHGRLAPVPIGLINGTAHDGGPHPAGVLAAVRRTIEQRAVPDSELAGLLGAPGPQSLTSIVIQIRAWAQHNANADTPAALTALENAL
jgi:hypothetical protein